MANIAQIVFGVFIFMLMLGDTVFAMLGAPLPDFVKQMTESKLLYAVGSFFIFAQVSSSLRSTGAFEITINDELVFSKLESGKMADAHML